MTRTKLLSNSRRVRVWFSNQPAAVFGAMELDGPEQIVGHVFLEYPKAGEWWPAPRQIYPGHNLHVSQTPYVLNDLYVAPAYRKNGVGRKLVAAVQKYAAHRQLPIVLYAQPYRSRGFNVTQLAGWYQERGFVYAGVYEGKHYLSWTPPITGGN